MSRWRALLSAVGSALTSDPTAEAWRPTKGRRLATTYGATGTLDFAGYLTDIDEYNSLFQVNQTGFAKYEEMRRGDPQVYALLAALGLPIRSARWDVAAPEAKAKPLEKQAADLVRENLFGGLEYLSPAGMSVSQSWDAVLSHALLMLPFGSAAVEEIWTLDGDTIRLARLAPRMPRTYWRWHVDDDGETLLVLEQIAYRGANLEFWKTPADKLTIFSFQKEGSYFAGRSMLRAVYKPWFFKQGLEKIETIAAERNGMGIPVGFHAPNASAEDRVLLNQWVTQISTHQSVGLGLPNGADFKLVGVAGKVFDCTPSIARYSQEITRAGLASFLDLGTTQTGARSVGDTLSEFFYVSEQALADAICWHLNMGCVRRLVDFNFPGKFGAASDAGLRYPRVVAANVKSRSIMAIIEYLDKLATANIIRPDQGLEDDIRQELGFPAADPKTVRLAGQAKVAVRDQQQGAAPSSAPAAAPAKTPGANAEPTTAKPGQTAAEVNQQANQEATHMSAAAVQFAREPRGVEKHVEFADVLDKLDGAKKEVASALRGAKKPMLANLASKLASTPVSERHQASLPLDNDLSGAVAGHLDGLYSFGRQTVRHEKTAQQMGAPPSEHPQLVSADATDAGKTAQDAAKKLRLLADTTVGQFQGQLASRAQQAALAAGRGGDEPDETDIITGVEAQPDGWIDRVAAEAANLAMANGRQDEFQQARNEIARFIYSALLDQNTCDECAAADGKEGQESDLPEVPNPDCEGGAQCRCMWVAVFKTEGKAA